MHILWLVDQLMEALPSGMLLVVWEHGFFYAKDSISSYRKVHDLLKRPCSGRGSQGGHWWKSVDTAKTGKKKCLELLLQRSLQVRKLMSVRQRFPLALGYLLSEEIRLFRNWRFEEVSGQDKYPGLPTRVNGESIRVWDDRWVPGPLLSKMVGSKPEGCTLKWVSEIIDREQSCWDEHLVRSAMMLCDSELILQLPVVRDVFLAPMEILDLDQLRLYVAVMWEEGTSRGLVRPLMVPAAMVDNDSNRKRLGEAGNSQGRQD
ncbi:hypothetical protein Cgig2_019332 [Carnegiea gigantea]|uniref:Uncharacterized protein n=1 Tax=Carnegiea gigantea TaxID=171969 RepID=A0A9Q1KPA2_9CARY|nr:hypothetical protein Cgig2_019332 [Carnegiea gigantea]